MCTVCTIWCYREQLGSDLVIIILTMPSAERRERILERHGGDVSSTDLMDVRILGCNTIHQHYVAAN